MKHTMYLHSDKSDLAYEGEETLGLSEKAIEKFMYALYEVKFDVEVNKKTGEVTILGITCPPQTFVPKV